MVYIMGVILKYNFKITPKMIDLHFCAEKARSKKLLHALNILWAIGQKGHKKSSRRSVKFKWCGVQDSNL